MWGWMWVGGFWQETATRAQGVFKLHSEASSQLRQTSVTVWAVQQPGLPAPLDVAYITTAGPHLVVPVISLHRCQLQLQAGHLGHQLQFLGLKGRPVQELLRNETRRLLGWSSVCCRGYWLSAVDLCNMHREHADLLETVCTF